MSEIKPHKADYQLIKPLFLFIKTRRTMLDEKNESKQLKVIIFKLLSAIENGTTELPKLDYETTKLCMNAEVHLEGGKVHFNFKQEDNE